MTPSIAGRDASGDGLRIRFVQREAINDATAASLVGLRGPLQSYESLLLMFERELVFTQPASELLSSIHVALFTCRFVIVDESTQVRKQPAALFNQISQRIDLAHGEASINPGASARDTPSSEAHTDSPTPVIRPLVARRLQQAAWSVIEEKTMSPKKNIVAIEDRRKAGQGFPLGDTGDGNTGVPDDQQGISNRLGDQDGDDLDDDDLDEDPDADEGDDGLVADDQ